MMMHVTAVHVVHEVHWYLTRPKDLLPQCTAVYKHAQLHIMHLFDSSWLYATMD